MKAIKEDARIIISKSNSDYSYEECCEMAIIEMQEYLKTQGMEVKYDLLHAKKSRIMSEKNRQNRSRHKRSLR